MLVTFQFKVDTLANWAAANPVLDRGEPGYEEDTGRYRIGDGVTRFTDLPVQSYDAAALQTLTDTAVAAAGGGQTASDTTVGVVELATPAEAIAGTDPLRAVTPLALAGALAAVATPPAATATVQGTVFLATSAEANAGTNGTKAITPATLAARLAALNVTVGQATTAAAGVVELATTTEATAGTDTVRATTPAGVNAAIHAIVDSLAVSSPTSLRALSDVSVPARVVDALGNVIVPGPVDGQVLTWDADLQKFALQDVQHPDYTNVYQPYDPLFRFFVPGFRITAATPAIPSDFPDLGVTFDELHPDADLAFTVNQVPAATGTVTLPDPGVAIASRLVLTGNTTVGLPAVSEGKTIRILIQQDTVGGRTLTVGPASAIVWGDSSTGAMPAMPTAANSSMLLEFESFGGNFWRCVNWEKFGAAVVSAKVAPSLRGSAFGATTGAANNLASVSVTLPTGIATGDRGRILVSRDGTDSPTPGPAFTVPVGWTILETTAGVSTMAVTTWLLGRDMASTDSGNTVTLTFSASARIGAVGAVIRGAAATGEVRVATTQASSASVTVPGFTPSADNSFELVFSAIRFASSTGPTVAPSSGSPLTEVLEITEGRTASINYTVYLATRTLSGQGGLPQPADALALTGANGVNQTYVDSFAPA